jgi:integrase
MNIATQYSYLQVKFLELMTGFKKTYSPNATIYSNCRIKIDCPKCGNIDSPDRPNWKIGGEEMEVAPIRDLRKIAEMKETLKSVNGRDELLFVMGINTALRISDLLSIHVGDVLDEEGKIHEVISLKECKTGKAKRFPLNATVKKALSGHLAKRPGCNRSEPLFLSRKSGVLSRSQAWRILKMAGETIGLSNIGTHSLRKTFGYQVYKKTADLGLVQKLMNHSTSKVTLRYIGIDRETMDSTYMNLNL